MLFKNKWFRIGVVALMAGAAAVAGLRVTHARTAFTKLRPHPTAVECASAPGGTGDMLMSPIFANANNPGGWIEISSFQWGVGRGISSPTGGSADRESSIPSVSEIVVTKPTDTATPTLFHQATLAAQPAVAVTICAFKPNSAGTADYLQLDLENVLISSFSMSSGGDRPQESITLNFTKITMSFDGGNSQSLQRASLQGRPAFDFQTIHLGS